MRVISVNVNGLRSATSKGFFEWLAQSGADVVCLQEIRIQPHQLSFDHQPEGWHSTFFPAEKAGYAGTAIYSKQKPDAIEQGLGFELCDSEGRWLAARFGELTLRRYIYLLALARRLHKRKKMIFFVNSPRYFNNGVMKINH